MSVPQAKYISMTKQKAFAWAQYFVAVNDRHGGDVRHYHHIQTITTNDIQIPEHIKTELLAMGEELRKTWECPICIDMIEPKNLDITPCGHYFCKDCLAGLKQNNPNDCKCPVCRRKLRTE